MRTVRGWSSEYPGYKLAIAAKGGIRPKDDWQIGFEIRDRERPGAEDYIRIHVAKLFVHLGCEIPQDDRLISRSKSTESIIKEPSVESLLKLDTDGVVLRRLERATGIYVRTGMGE
jgi:hypothetical protein